MDKRTTSTLIQEFIQSLEEEIEAIKKVKMEFDNGRS